MTFRKNYRGANLWGADLTDANLLQAEMRGAHLFQANLTHAMLRGANLTKADLQFANLQGANLWKANLSDAGLSLANLTGADLTGAILDNVTWPEGWTGGWSLTMPMSLLSCPGGGNLKATWQGRGSPPFCNGEQLQPV